MPSPVRYPDAASPYFIIRNGAVFEVHHQDHGLLCVCDCLGEARNQIADAEDEDAEQAARDLAEQAEADECEARYVAAGLTLTAALTALLDRQAA